MSFSIGKSRNPKSAARSPGAGHSSDSGDDVCSDAAFDRAASKTLHQCFSRLLRGLFYPSTGGSSARNLSAARYAEIMMRVAARSGLFRGGCARRHDWQSKR
jgi:hypothetical protein